MSETEKDALQKLMTYCFNALVSGEYPGDKFVLPLESGTILVNVKIKKNEGVLYGQFNKRLDS